MQFPKFISKIISFLFRKKYIYIYLTYTKITYLIKKLNKEALIIYIFIYF